QGLAAAQREEAQLRYDALTGKRARSPRLVPDEDYRAARLNRERCLRVEQVQARVLRKAERALLGAHRPAVPACEGRSPGRGVVAAICRAPGEAVHKGQGIVLVRQGVAPGRPPRPGGPARVEAPARVAGKLLLVGAELGPGEKLAPAHVISVEV